MIKRYCLSYDNTLESRDIIYSLLSMVHTLLDTPVSEPTTMNYKESGTALLCVYLLNNEKLAECVTSKMGYLLTHVTDKNMIDLWVKALSVSLQEKNRLERLVDVLNSTMNKKVAWCLLYIFNLAIQEHPSLFKRNAVGKGRLIEA